MSLPARPGFGFARRHGATVRALDETQAEIIHRPGVSPEVIAELRRHVARPIVLSPHSADEYERLLRQLYEGGADDARAMAADFDERADLNQLVDALPEPQDLLESEDEAPIIRLINALLTEAVKENASDIHLEPFEHSLLVRFRVDGVLREVLRPQKAVAQPVVSRIKVMAKLDIAEKRLPQDGRISLRIAGRPVDVRVSTIPAGFGERVVLRLLDKQAGRLDLAELGMDPVTLGHVDRLIHRPHGILLVTGPTGSGKTTTLYAALSRLNDSTRNILTVEDPIEYYLDGVGQTQVNPKVDMTFARGLRAILRQDPDVVMVGEIRDLETAEIAVQASLTGHLVLSTLHTNSAVGAVTRLRDMGVEPFLLSSSLLGVLAQRLVRRLDPAQSEWYTPSASECAAFGRQPTEGLRFARPRGDLPGRASGYRGRSGVYEVVLVDEAMRALIHGGASEAEMTRAARQYTPSILDDGWAKVSAGLTTADEVLRVTRDD
ncbi:type II secretion system ATPase GspE [uncultured Aquimonas sp.]|uniref:type II secretion system ATPase GspE n=1 Tax=uncultured Aquimonas sp. TaxID=385483 RepID=UPI00086C3DE5|nr:type II secretion system ATPase GspE [uncultured Aquimonas sp.]ODU40917.1 MAG: type II secretion system protein GspE [Xanthomonadaceae bacterium SCN 69-123]